ncbi:MAG: S49 family peptidase [Prevotellaceae bacterium]|jgi:ClpP class serine protease|nr:S49 family peptidase [Prevotellaceae bacterium]
MQYSFIRELYNPWLIDSVTLRQYAPVLHGVLTLGLHFEQEKPDESYQSYGISLATKSKIVNNDKEKQIFVQPVIGTMMKLDSASGIIGTRTMANNLLDADSRTNVIGHVLFIESGGGQASAVPELTNAIQKLTKPVVAFVDGCMASAAMWIGSCCHQIIASSKDDMIGCIGTMIIMQGFSKFNKDTDGFTTVRIYADDATEKNDEYEAALTGDFKLIKERILNPMNEQFVNAIRENRPNVKDEHLKGRTFMAAEVVGTLIDSIGDFNSAIEAVTELSKSKKINNSKIMKNESKLTALLAVLALTALAIEDGSTSLNEEQLDAIDAALDTGNKAATELATAKEDLQKVNATIAERDDTIKSLNEKIAELEKKPGAVSGSAIDNIDDNTEQNSYISVRNELKGKKN